MTELLKAAKALKSDLLERAEWADDAVKVVAAGNGVWFRFCQAIENAEARHHTGAEDGR